ncbi:alpha-mannosidase [Nakamurella sp. GG22]
MRDDEWQYRGRLGRFLEELVVPAIYPRVHQLDVAAWPVPDEPVPAAVALGQRYERFAVGTAWGKAWSTLWLHITGQVPALWLADGSDVEIVVDLGFRARMEGGQAEGLAFRPDGTIIKAIEPYNRYLPVEDPSGRIDLYLEAAANPELADYGSWHPTPLGDKATAGDEPIYLLRQVDVAVRDREVDALRHDLEVLASLADELPADLPRRAELVAGLNRAIDVVDPSDVAGTASTARAVLRPLLTKPAYASAHRIVATGHAHIDSAWLWPVRETVRKCARTFANVLDLMDQDPDVVFSCSSAQQYAWVKEHYPHLWDRIKEKVAEGRFVPVGGMWVESDTNMPGSEAMARQFVLGTMFFREELGVDPREVWLPDSFGYSAALPQIARAAGKQWFLTQKISWNETNAFPHHSFLWEGIDGTRIFTHFPPVDTYNSTLSAAELARAQRQYREHGHGTVSLVPFGYGDGGGGPTREMLERAHRAADLEGSPRVQIGTAARFFADAEAELASPAVWSGELYLETHRGTYTSQLRTKQGNRRSEHALRAAELWATTAFVRVGLPYPTDELREIWRTVLLQQFHDILPGSAIAWVHREAEANYRRVLARLEQIVIRSLQALVGSGDLELIANAAPVTLDGVAPMAVVTAPGATSDTVNVTERDGGFLLDNGRLRVTIDGRGVLTSVLDLAADREVVPPGQAAGLLQLHNDRPTRYEAWDIDEHYRRVSTDLVTVDELVVLPTDDGSAAVRVSRSTTRSTIVETITLRPGAAAVDFGFDINWHEDRTILKLAFPVDCIADRAASEIQFGHVYRPTHENTSWERAKFETCAHRWVHVGEPGWGVAVANDSTYGHDIHRTVVPATGKAATTVRLSLLRGPKFPDPQTDRGRHTLSVSLVVGAEIADAVRAGQRLNQPVRVLRGGHPVEPIVAVSDPGVLVEAVKLAEDGSGDVVVRLYESLGRRTRATLLAGFEHRGAEFTDLLEQPVGAVTLAADGGIALEVRPFQIVTVRFARAVSADPAS